MTADQLIKNSLIQTAITLSSTLLVPIMLFMSYVPYEILPLILMFLLFNIAYNKRNRTLQIVSISIFALAYLVAVLFFSGLFADNALIMITSALVMAYYHVKYTGGKKRDYLIVFIPGIISFVQLIMFIFLQGGDSDAYFSRVLLKDKSEQAIVQALFLALSLIANYATIIFKKWWLALPLAAIILLITNSIYNNVDLLTLVIPKLYFSIYIMGIVLTIIINNLLCNDNTERIWYKLDQENIGNHTEEIKLPPKVWILSLIQGVIIFSYNLSFRTALETSTYITNKLITTSLVCTLLIYLYNTASYRKDIKNRLKTLFAIAIVCLLTWIYIGDMNFPLIEAVIMFVMLISSYPFFSNLRWKKRV